MTPDDSAFLSIFGLGVFEGMVDNACTCIVYGLYLLAFFTAFFMFCNKGVEGRNAKILLFCLVLVFFTFSWDFVTRNATIMRQLDLTLKQSVKDVESEYDAAGAHLVKWDLMQFWGPTVNLMIGDGLVLWRAWVIWDARHKIERRALLAFLVTLMVGNIAVNIADAAFDDLGISIQLSEGAITLDWVSLVLSLSVNMVATLLIGLKVRFLYHQFKSLRHTRKNSHVKNVLIILVESGLVFCVIQFVYAVINGVEEIKDGIALYFCYAVITAVANGCAALYPAAMIIVVHLESSPLTSYYDSNMDTSIILTTPV